MTQSDMDEPMAGPHARTLCNELTEARTDEWATQLEKLKQELRSYPELGVNWDGYGAKSPSQEAVNDALRFLDCCPMDIPPPHVSIWSEGDIGVYWDNRQSDVDVKVVFVGDGTYRYFAAHGKAGSEVEKYMDEDVDVSSAWPDEILSVLRKQSGP